MTVKGTVSGRGKTLWNAPIVVSAAFDANSNFAAGIALAGSGVSSCGTNTGSGNVTPRNFTMGQKRIPWTGNINADISAATGVDLTVSMMPKFSAQANPKFTAGFSAVPALSCLPKGVVKVSAFGGGALDVGMMGKPVTTVWKQSNTSLYNQCW